MSIDVWFVMLPGVLSLDMTGPAETFVLAGDAFRLHYIGPAGRGSDVDWSDDGRYSAAAGKPA